MTLAVPSGPLTDASGNVTPAWRAYLSGGQTLGATVADLAAETARATAAEADLQRQISAPVLGAVRAGTDPVDSASSLTLVFTPAFPNNLLFFSAIDPAIPTAPPLTITALISHSPSGIQVTVHNTSGAMPAGTIVGWYAIGN